MKNILITFLLISSAFTLLAQTSKSKFEKQRLSAELSDQNEVAKMVTNLNTNDDTVFSQVKELFKKNSKVKTPTGGSQKKFDILATKVAEAFDDVEKENNVAVILIFRHFAVDTAAVIEYKPDYSDIYNKVYHHRYKALSTYLLETKKIYYVLIDVGKRYYVENPDEVGNRLSSVETEIVYKKSFFKQSADVLKDVIKAMGASTGVSLEFTLIEMDPAQIKAPCDILIKNPKFKSNPTFSVHEKNVTSFQVGVVNNKFTASDVSLGGGNLTVKPSSDQLADWKSHAFALFEVHLPRDIDNFRPLWSTLFHKASDQPNRDVGQWIVDNVIARIGIYGGAKISKDPLSDLYAGFNFAITKEVAINLGWNWSNTYVNQVTAVGDISSVSEALKYAHRTYARGKFAIGLSFSPATVLSDWGLKK